MMDLNFMEREDLYLILPPVDINLSPPLYLLTNAELLMDMLAYSTQEFVFHTVVLTLNASRYLKMYSNYLLGSLVNTNEFVVQ